MAELSRGGECNMDSNKRGPNKGYQMQGETTSAEK